jgi:hypothetical protein
VAGKAAGVKGGGQEVDEVQGEGEVEDELGADDDVDDGEGPVRVVVSVSIGTQQHMQD